MQNTLRSLSKKLGYTFKEMVWLELALTHRSHGDKNNERLEFLGDSLLNFCIAKKLFHQYPNYKEGDLSRLRANLVNGEVLAALAKELGISAYLRMGAGELRSGGLERKSTLANTMEAIIGAIYLDGGMDACMQQIMTWFCDSFIETTSRGLKKDPKTQLQEHLQARKMALPVYTVLAIKGNEHSQLFQVQCQVAGSKKTTLGEGSSRRRAEQDAAMKLLELLGVSA